MPETEAEREHRQATDIWRREAERLRIERDELLVVIDMALTRAQAGLPVSSILRRAQQTVGEKAASE